MSITIAIFLGLSVTIIFLFMYIFSRDKAIEKKFHLISLSLENINQEIYKIQKQQQAQMKDVDSLIMHHLEEMISSLVENLNKTQYKNQKEIEVLFEKILKIESEIKNISLPNKETKINYVDKDRVKELYEIGYSLDEISKEIGLSISEVQMLLNF